jgi:hypothetical protein
MSRRHTASSNHPKMLISTTILCSLLKFDQGANKNADADKHARCLSASAYLVTSPPATAGLPFIQSSENIHSPLVDRRSTCRNEETPEPVRASPKTTQVKPALDCRPISLDHARDNRTLHNSSGASRRLARIRSAFYLPVVHTGMKD